MIVPRFCAKISDKILDRNINSAPSEPMKNLTFYKKPCLLAPHPVTIKTSCPFGNCIATFPFALKHRFVAGYNPCSAKGPSQKGENRNLPSSARSANGGRGGRWLCNWNRNWNWRWEVVGQGHPPALLKVVFRRFCVPLPILFFISNNVTLLQKALYQ